MRFALPLVILLLAPTAPAALVHSGLVNIAIPTDFAGVYLDLDTGVISNTAMEGWDINPFFGGSEIATNSSFLPVRSGSGAFDPILNLGIGTVLSDSTQFFSSPGLGGSGSFPHQPHLGSALTQFQTAEVGYIGFRFTTNAVPGPAEGPFFGWMEVRLTPNTTGGVIQRWAYEDSGAPVVVPEPSTFGALAGLAMFALALRRSRNMEFSTAPTPSTPPTSRISKQR